MPDLDLSRPFTRAAATRHGISYGELRGPRFRTVFRGIYVTAGVAVDTEIRARAAVLLHPWSAFLSHETAAVLQGIPVPLSPDVHLTVTDRKDRRSRPGLRTHAGVESDVHEVRGLRMSTGNQLFCELAQHLGLVDLVVAGDALVRAGRTTAEALAAAAAELGGTCAAHAQRAAAYVSPRVDSVMESRLRMLLLLAGFPAPLVNATVNGDNVHYRPDLCWPELRLVVEYDGRQHRDDLDQWDHDIARREWFEAHDWVLLTVVARDVFQRPDETVRRVHDAWVRRGGRRFDLRDDWRAWFEVRRSA